MESKEIKPKVNQKQKAKIRNPFTIKKEKKLKTEQLEILGYVLKQKERKGRNKSEKKN